jgi:hypothetical protein
MLQYINFHFASETRPHCLTTLVLSGIMFYFLVYVVWERSVAVKNRSQEFDEFTYRPWTRKSGIWNICLSICMCVSLASERLDGFCSNSIFKSLFIAGLCSETSVDFQRTTRRYIPEDRTLHNHRCDKTRSFKHDIFATKNSDDEIN